MTSTAKPVITSYKQFYTSPWGIAFIAYFVAMGLVGALTPADILKVNPWAREFCDFMAGIVPQIDAVTKLNIAPDINRFYFSVMWAGSPIVFIFLVVSTWVVRKENLPESKLMWRQASGKYLLVLGLICILVTLAVFQFNFKFRDPLGITRATFEYRLGRVFIPQCFVLMAVVFASAGFILLIDWLKRCAPRSIKKQNELEQKK
jgi:hypothetical protein